MTYFSSIRIALLLLMAALAAPLTAQPQGSYKFGKKAVTFNPAGMSVITKILNTTKSSFSSNIHSYIYLTDLLNIVQELTSYFPFLSLQADGTRHYVWDKIPRKLSIDEFHGMKGFLSYMGTETTERTSFTEKG